MSRKAQLQPAGRTWKACDEAIRSFGYPVRYVEGGRHRKAYLRIAPDREISIPVQTHGSDVVQAAYLAKVTVKRALRSVGIDVNSRAGERA